MAVINNTFTEIGDVGIIKTFLQITGIVFFREFKDVTTGEETNRFFKREIRYSYDGVLFSEWLEIVDSSAYFELNITGGFLFLEYRYTREGSDDTGALAILSVDLDTMTSRSFLPKLESLTNTLYPTGLAWKNKIEKEEFKPPVIIFDGLEEELEAEIVG